MPDLNNPCPQATPEELAKYAERSLQYYSLAIEIENGAVRISPKARLDPQVRALAGTFAAECREHAKRWADEKEGGL